MMIKMYLTNDMQVWVFLAFYKLHVIWIFVMDRCYSLNFKSIILI